MKNKFFYIEDRLLKPNTPCPCNSGKKWKKCCLGRKTRFQVIADEVVKHIGPDHILHNVR